MDVDSRNQLEALLEYSSDIVTLVDADSTIRYHNSSIKRILGYEPEQLVGERAFEFMHPDSRERVVDAFEGVVGSPGDVTERVEYRFRHADGSWVWLESITTNQTETELDGYVINSRDITQRKQRERELAEERKKYTTVVEQSHDAIAIHRDERFVFTNARCREMLGYSEDELIGKPIKEIVAPEDRELVEERYRHRIDPESESPPSRYETRFLTKDGQRRFGEISATAIQFEGEPADLVMIRDVTDRKQYETQLQEMTEELEALNRVVRHDIRNDMTIVLGWAEMLEDHVDDRGQEHLRKILASGEHIVELTDIARDYVETLTSDEKITLTPTPLRAILETELDLRRESFPEATFVSPGEIPDVEILANEMLGSVFRNLLNNAVQHNDTDEPVVEITCEMHDDDVLVQIADNGPGIPNDQKDSVFGKDEKGLESPGTGIGLYLVQTLVSQYDGDVWVEDNDPTGAIFTVQFPKAD